MHACKYRLCNGYKYRLVMCRLYSVSVTGQGLGSEQDCLGPAVLCRFLPLPRKHFTTQVQVTMRMCLLKLGTVEQGRA